MTDRYAQQLSARLLLIVDSIEQIIEDADAVEFDPVELVSVEDVAESLRRIANRIARSG